MNKGVQIAKTIIDDLNLDIPNKYSLTEIIYALNGPLIKEEPMKSAEGRIVCADKYSIITVNSNIQSEGKKRFTIAHELGHYLMHRNVKKIFNCDNSNMMDFNYRSINYKEVEANNFASELLLPEEVFYSYSRKEKFSLDFIKHISDEFKTSITATSLRFAEKGNDPILLVCSQNGIIKWFKRNDKFPFVKIEIGNEVPVNSVIFDYIRNGNLYSRPEEINPSDWTVSRPYPGLKYYEQCFLVDTYGYALSYIYISK